MVYLCSPYSRNPDLYWSQTIAVAARLFAKGVMIFSPILHCRPLEVEAGLPGDASFWINYNRHMLDRAANLWILPLKGWEESKGIQLELEHAKFLGLPTYLVDPQTLELSEL